MSPTAIYRQWFPAVVVLPDGQRLQKAKAYATDAGLIVYTQAQLPDPVFTSPILLDKTSKPGTDYASEQRGHVITTEAGKVTVTKMNACSTCGLHRIFNWKPVWALNERAWGE
jgi:hypothetical protein